MFDGQLSIGTGMILSSVVFHVIALVYLAGLLTKAAPVLHARFQHKTQNTLLLAMAVLVIIAIHTVEAWSWALLFLWLGEFEELKRALYFSVVTSTTLGYGDITLSDRWQLLGTFEAMGGLILFGASTAFLLELMRNLFASPFAHRDT